MLRSLRVETMRPYAIVIAILAIALPVPLSSQEDVSERLKAGNVLILRHFYVGEALTFAPDGTLVGSAETGPWTVAAQIKVRNAKISAGNLVIRGRRLLLVFDPETKKMRDLLGVSEKDALAASFRPPQHEEVWKATARGQEVTITIQSSSNAASFADFSSAVSAVFLRPDEALADVAPAFWHDFLCGCSSRTTELDASEPVISAKESGARPSHALSAPGPIYSESARSSQFSGVVGLSLVVDKSGSVRDIQILKPAGLGLDEQSVEAVRQWRFEPAWKDAEPVTSRVGVEVSFRLY
jgi:TonB family protein